MRGGQAGGRARTPSTGTRGPPEHPLRMTRWPSKSCSAPWTAFSAPTGRSANSHTTFGLSIAQEHHAAPDRDQFRMSDLGGAAPVTCNPGSRADRRILSASPQSVSLAPKDAKRTNWPSWAALAPFLCGFSRPVPRIAALAGPNNQQKSPTLWQMPDSPDGDWR